MRILHLTDLHICGEGSRAVANWQTARSHFDDRFDFVVVSGDLANTGKPREYERVAELLALARDRVKDGDPARVVIVPGNHDVDYDAEVSDRRFDGFDALVKAFYAEGRPRRGAAAAAAGGHLFFDFSGPGDRFHWSAHLFPDDGVVFYGLNSCHMNDKVWRGGSLSRQAVEGVRQHAEAHAGDLIRVAVWHHGLTGGRGDSDFITTKELSDLAVAGMSLGIHGHTHSDEQRNLEDVLRRRFPVVATGSFGAEQRSRPDGVRNQFSILSVDRNRVKCRVYEFDDAGDRWRASDAQASSLGSPDPLVVRAELEGAAEIARHARSVVVDQDGIATVSVRMEGVALEGPLVLAHPIPGFGRLELDPQVTAERRGKRGGTVQDKLDVEHQQVRHRFVLPANTDERTYAQISWSYYFSNGFALDGVDALLGQRREQPYLPLGPDEDAYVYCVEAHTQELSLSLELGAAKTIEAVAPVVQRPVRDGPVLMAWENDPDEIRHVQLAPAGSPTNRIALTVRSPRVGHRYGFLYRLGLRREPLERDAEVCVREMLERCRREPFRPGGTAGLFTAALDGALEDALGVAGPPSFWMSHLWSMEGRRLLPAFGRFPPESWGGSFECGEGVAGHAFRVRGPAVYFHDQTSRNPTDQRKTRLIYKEGRLRPHLWIIGLPILLARRSPVAVGVIGFCDQGIRNKADEKLAQLAFSVAWGGKRAQPTLNRLCRALSHAFWKAAARYDLPDAGHIYETRWKKR